MQKSVKHFEETFESTDLVQTMLKSFLEYSMSVIVSRALPDVRDGFAQCKSYFIWRPVNLGDTGQTA